MLLVVMISFLFGLRLSWLVNMDLMIIFFELLLLRYLFFIIFFVNGDVLCLMDGIIFEIMMLKVFVFDWVMFLLFISIFVDWMFGRCCNCVVSLFVCGIIKFIDGVRWYFLCFMVMWLVWSFVLLLIILWIMFFFRVVRVIIKKRLKVMEMMVISVCFCWC